MPLSASTPAFGKGTERSATYYKKLFASIGTTAEPGDEARRAGMADRSQDQAGRGRLRTGNASGQLANQDAGYDLLLLSR